MLRKLVLVWVEFQLYLQVLSADISFSNSLDTDQAVRPQGYETFFMLNSTEHEISTAHKKLKYRQMKKDASCFNLSVVVHVFILLINVKMPTIVGILTFMSRILNVKMPAIVGILTFMSRINFMLS